MSIEVVETTKHDVLSLYQSIFASIGYGMITDLTEILKTPLFFSLSNSGELAKLETGNGALFSCRRNSRGFISLRLYNTDDYSSFRHPMFYGGLFLDEAMNYYQMERREVRGFDCIWEPGTTNYASYWRLINSGFDPYTATVNTWTGKMAERYQYSILQYPRNELIDGQWVLTARFGIPN